MVALSLAVPIVFQLGTLGLLLGLTSTAFFLSMIYTVNHFVNHNSYDNTHNSNSHYQNGGCVRMVLLAGLVGLLVSYIFYVLDYRWGDQEWLCECEELDMPHTLSLLNDDIFTFEVDTCSEFWPMLFYVFLLQIHWIAIGISFLQISSSAAAATTAAVVV